MSKSKIASGLFVNFLFVVILTGCVKTSGGKPWIDSDLKRNIKRGMKISEKDDFHLAVNYDWLLKNNIPKGANVIRAASLTSSETEEKVKAVLTDKKLQSHEAELVQDFYSAFLDWDARNALGSEPIKKTLDDIEKIRSISELSDFISDAEKSYGVPVFFTFKNSASNIASSLYVVQVDVAPLILFDSAEYGKRTKFGKQCYKSQKKAFAQLYKNLGHTKKEADQLFDTVINFESKIAASSLSTAEKNNPNTRVSNIGNLTFTGLCNKARSFPFKERLESLGYGEAKFFYPIDAGAIYRIGELYNEENLSDIKAYMTVKFILNFAAQLEKKSYEISLKARNEIYGISGHQDEKNYAYAFTNQMMPEILAKAYLEKYDCKKLKSDVTDVSEKIISGYKKMLRDETWLSEEARRRTIEKLDYMKINVAYPDVWTDCNSLSFEGLSFFEIMKTLKNFQRKIDVEKTNCEVDSSVWQDSDFLAVNAYYSPYSNSINIFLGILGGEYYREDMTKEELYGGIGSVIAHEISHAFDTVGAQFDKNGNWTSLLQRDDLKAFESRAAKLIAYYDTIECFGGVKVQGSRVQNEATSDIGAMKCLLEIASDEPDFDYDVFFRRYANVWKELASPSLENYWLTRDTHPLNYLRTNVTLQQFEKFYETYDVKEGDGMYLAPKDRVSVW